MSSLRRVRASPTGIAAARAAGLAGVVIGASRPDGRLDGAAEGLELVLHRAFDLVSDMAEAVELAVALGFTRILTSGGAVSVWQGAAALAEAQRLAAGRLTIMPGGGIRADNIGTLLAAGPFAAFHGSCSAPLPPAPALEALGFQPPGASATSVAEIRALRAALDLHLAAGDPK